MQINNVSHGMTQLPDPVSKAREVAQDLATPNTAKNEDINTAFSPVNEGAESAGFNQSKARPDSENSARAAALEDKARAQEVNKEEGKRAAVREERREAIESVETAKNVSGLKKRDAEVRAHERAHAASGGQYTGAPSFEYETGSDGKRYAVAGEVSVSTSPVANDPSATIEKMKTIRAAALAPANPSPADRAIASQASRTEARASAELVEMKLEDVQKNAEHFKQERETKSEAAETRKLEEQAMEKSDNTQNLNATDEKKEPERDVSQENLERNGSSQQQSLANAISAPPKNTGGVLDLVV